MAATVPCVEVGHEHRHSMYECPDQLGSILGSATGRGVRIAVIDSGWDRTLSCPRVCTPIGVARVDAPFETARSDGWDRIGHGTACADIILRFAPEAEIVPIRVFGSRLETSVRVLCAAMDMAARARVDLVNMSLGTMLRSAEGPLSERCAALADAGIYVVSAAHAKGLATYPAVLERVIGVRAGRLPSPFDLRFDPNQQSSFLAHAEHQQVPWLHGVRSNVHATSFAAPSLTGIAALLIELRRSPSLADLVARLIELAAGSGQRERSRRVDSERGGTGLSHAV